MIHSSKNIVLIGMPGSGKSTVGIILAKKLAKEFIDTDLLIQTSQGKKLQDLIDLYGYMGLRNIEEDILIQIETKNHIIATGGSAAYSHKAMEHLKLNGCIVFLDVSIAALLKRIHNFDTRGIAKRPDQSFEDLFKERFLLYTKYADITIKSSYLNMEETCESIISEISRLEPQTGFVNF